MLCTINTNLNNPYNLKGSKYFPHSLPRVTKVTVIDYIHDAANDSNQMETNIASFVSGEAILVPNNKLI